MINIKKAISCLLTLVMSFITIASNSCYAEESSFYLNGPVKVKVCYDLENDKENFDAKEITFEKSEKTNAKKSGKTIFKVLTCITSLATLSILLVNNYASNGNFGEALGKAFISAEAFCANKSGKFSESLNKFNDSITNKAPWLNLVGNKIRDYYSITKNNFKINFEKFNDILKNNSMEV